MDEAQREAFLATPRLGVLMMNREPAPIGVPLWFEWNGTTVEMFSNAQMPKIRRIKRNPNASVMAVNSVGEPEGWVAFDGTIEITNPGGIELATRLAERYWDLSDPTHRSILDGWQQSPDAMCQLTLTPAQIRSGPF